MKGIIHCCVVYKGLVFIVFLTMVTLDKEHDRDKRLSRTQVSVVSEHANKTVHYTLWEEVKFIDRDPHYYPFGA